MDAETNIFPPKPVLAEKQSNNLTRSMISLFIYGLLFYFLFDRNIAYIAAVLVVLLIHEFGHFFAMKLYNYRNVKLFIIPLIGAFVSGKKQSVSQKQMSIIILAGPVPGILIGTALYIINKTYPYETLKMLANVFIFINIFNLIPIYPLDGGRLLENLFIKNNYGIRLAFTILSVLFLVILISLSGNFIMVLIPAIMVYELFNEGKNQKIRDYLDAEKLQYHLEYADLPDKNYWLIRDCILFSFQKKYNGVQPGVYQYSVIEPLLLQHVISVLKPHFNNDLSAFQKALFLTLYLFFLIGIPVTLFIMYY
ncbi:MAG TPA: site-2 protease family protein [Bacteroidia bacterium]|jgi:stage IV sporulation protein FB|nr:site-2 protease family protein [Bacteroidia bacterium]